MWCYNITKEQWQYIANTMDKLGLSFVWNTGDYTSIKMKEEYWKQYFPYYCKSMNI
jgi:hypothetical protein